MHYQGPADIDQKEFLTKISRDRPSDLPFAMVSAAFHIEDWQWLQDRFMELIHHDDYRVRSTAATCLGHVARIHGQLDLVRVRPLVVALMDDELTRRYVTGALEDIDAFATDAPSLPYRTRIQRT